MRALSLLTESLMLGDYTKNLRFGSQIRRVLSADRLKTETLCNSLHFYNCVLRILCYHAERQNPQARKYYELLCDIIKTGSPEVR
jgi:hypothetical protein